MADIHLTFLDTAMDYLQDVDDFGHSTEPQVTEIKAEVELELDEQLYSQTK